MSAHNPGPSLEEIDDFIEATGNEKLAAVTEFLMEYPTSADEMSSMGWTALVTAAGAGNREMVALLLEQGASVDKKNSSGETPLMHAADEGECAVAALLLEKGANIDAQDKDGWTALMSAVKNRDESMVKLLLEKGADIDIEANIDSDGYCDTAVSHAEFRGFDDMVELLKNSQAAVKKEQAREQWLEDTDFSRGLQRPIVATRPLKCPSSGPKP